jgi:hypothetical protein
VVNPKQKTISEKIYLKTIAVEILLGLSVGSVTSLLLFLGFYHYKGAADLMEILPMFFGLIFINTPYSYLFRLVLLVPMYAPVFSILVTRTLIQNTTSRKSWIFPIFSVASVSALIAVAITIIGALAIGYGDGSLYLKVITLSLPFILLGFLAGLLPGYLFAPARRIFKILIAVLTSALVGAFFEIAYLIYIVR